MEFVGVRLLLHHFYIIGLEAVDGGAVAEDADAVEDDLLKFRCEGHGDFGAVLYAGFVGDVADVVGVFGIAVEIALQVVQGIIIAVADIVPGRFFSEVGMGLIEPSREGAGFYMRKGL